MAPTELSLVELAAASGVEGRTIRSWVAQGLLPAPLTRGPAARYPADTLERVLAVCAMRDALGMPIAEIRKELLVADRDQIRGYANRAAGLAQEAQPSPAATERAPATSSALDYISRLRTRAGTDVTPSAPPAQSAAPLPVRGFEALEQALAHGRFEPARKSRAEEWLRISITPDVELAVRAPLDAEQRTRLERCGDLIRDILLGRNQ